MVPTYTKIDCTPSSEVSTFKLQMSTRSLGLKGGLGPNPPVVLYPVPSNEHRRISLHTLPDVTTEEAPLLVCSHHATCVSIRLSPFRSDEHYCNFPPLRSLIAIASNLQPIAGNEASRSGPVYQGVVLHGGEELHSQLCTEIDTKLEEPKRQKPDASLPIGLQSESIGFITLSQNGLDCVAGIISPDDGEGSPHRL